MMESGESEKVNFMNSVKCILKKYNKMQQYQIKNFLLYDMEDEYIEEMIDVIQCPDDERKAKFPDILYEGDKYAGNFIDGNEYLITEKDGIVWIINKISEEFGMDPAKTRVSFSADDFIYIITHKAQVLE